MKKGQVTMRQTVYIRFQFGASVGYISERDSVFIDHQTRGAKREKHYSQFLVNKQNISSCGSTSQSTVYQSYSWCGAGGITEQPEQITQMK